MKDKNSNISAVAYCRFSSENQADGFSIEAQRKAIDDFASKNGIKVTEYYIDEARSAKNADRPAFQRMISDSASHRFSLVLVHKLDRFSRNPKDQAIYEDRLNKNGVKLYSVSEQFDETKPSGVLTKQIMVGVSAFYLANLSQEVLKGLREGAKEGYAVRVPPYGYDIVDRHYSVNLEKSRTVQALFRAFDSGYGLTELRRILNRPLSSLEHILRNRFYIGEVKVGEMSFPKTAPSIISEDLFYRVQDRLDTSSGKCRKRSKSPDNLLSEESHVYCLTGILFDAQGRKFSGAKGVSHTGKVHRYYQVKGTSGSREHPVSRRYIREELVEEAAVRAVLECLSSPKIVRKTAEAINRGKSSDSPEVAKSLADVRARRKKLMDGYLNGVVSDDMYRSTDRELVIEEASLKSKQVIAVKEKVTEEQISLALEWFRARIEASKDNPNERRKLIRLFIKSATIDGRTMRVQLVMPSGMQEKTLGIDESAKGSTIVQNGGVEGT